MTIKEVVEKTVNIRKEDELKKEKNREFWTGEQILKFVEELHKVVNCYTIIDNKDIKIRGLAGSGLNFVIPYILTYEEAIDLVALNVYKSRNLDLVILKDNDLTK